MKPVILRHLGASRAWFFPSILTSTAPHKNETPRRQSIITDSKPFEKRKLER